MCGQEEFTLVPDAGMCFMKQANWDSWSLLVSRPQLASEQDPSVRADITDYLAAAAAVEILWNSGLFFRVPLLS